MLSLATHGRPPRCGLDQLTWNLGSEHTDLQLCHMLYQLHYRLIRMCSRKMSAIYDVRERGSLIHFERGSTKRPVASMTLSTSALSSRGLITPLSCLSHHHMVIPDTSTSVAILAASPLLQDSRPVFLLRPCIIVSRDRTNARAAPLQEGDNSPDTPSLSRRGTGSGTRSGPATRGSSSSSTSCPTRPPRP